MLEQFLLDRISALEAENKKLKLEEVRLTTFIHELLMKETPQAYKDVVRREVFNQ